MKLSPYHQVLLGLILLILADNHASQAQRREEVIKDWIRTIREAPKGHSMSPSWTSKARPRVIGTGELPLQNEVSAPSADNYPIRPKFTSNNPFSNSGFRTKRYPGNLICKSWATILQKWAANCN